MGIATDSLQTYFFRFGILIIGFINGVLTARFLGPSGKGILALAFLVNSLYINIFGNLGGAIAYQISRLRQSSRTVLLTASIYSLVVGVGSIIGFGVYRLIIPDARLNFLWFIAINAPVGLITTNLNGVFLGNNRVIFVNCLGFGAGFLLMLLMGAGFFLFSFRVVETLAVWVIAQLAMFGWGIWVSRDYWQGFSINDFKPGLLLEMLAFGWQIGLINLVTFLNYRIDMFLVAHFLGAERLGLYSIAVAGAEVLWFTSSALGTAIYARVGMVEAEEAGRLTARAIRHTLLINFLLGIVIWAAAEIALPLIYGEIYRASLIPFRLLLPGVLAYGVAGIFSTFFANQLGKPHLSLVVSLISVCLNLSTSIWLIPRYGMSGGAFATSVSYLVAVTFLIIIFKRQTGLPITEIFWLSQSDFKDYLNLAGKIRLLLGKFR